LDQFVRKRYSEEQDCDCLSENKKPEKRSNDPEHNVHREKRATRHCRVKKKHGNRILDLHAPVQRRLRMRSGCALNAGGIEAMAAGGLTARGRAIPAEAMEGQTFSGRQAQRVNLSGMVPGASRCRAQADRLR
jgi:hypothetical protein